MNPRLAFAARAFVLVGLAFGAAAHAEESSSPASSSPAAATPEAPFQSKLLPDLLRMLEKEKVPYEIDIRILARCLGAQCSGTIKPNGPRPPPPQVDKPSFAR